MIKTYTRKVQTVLRAVCFILACMSALSVLSMTLLVSYTALSRYLFGVGVSISIELSSFLLVACIFLALPYTALQNKHVRLEFIISRLEGRARAVSDLVTHLVSLLFIALLVYLTTDFTIQAYNLNAHSEQARLYEPPWRALMPIGLLLMGLVVLSRIIESIHAVLSRGAKNPEPEGDL